MPRTIDVLCRVCGAHPGDNCTALRDGRPLKWYHYDRQEAAKNGEPGAQARTP